MRRILRFWFDFAHRYRWWYAVGLVCLGGTVLLSVAIPQFVKFAVDALEAGEQAAATRWGLTIIVAGVGVIIVRTLSRTLFFNPGRTVEFRVKVAMFDRLLELPRWFYDRMKAGDIISRGTNDTNAMRGLIGFGTLQLFNVVLTLVATVGQMAWMNWALTLWCVAPLVVAALVMRYAVLSMFTLQAQLQAQVATLSERILESYNGVAQLQSYNAVDGALRRFDADNERHLDLGHRLLKIRAWLMPVVSFTSNLCVVIVLFVGGRMAMAGELSTGEIAAFIVYLQLVAAGLMSMSFLIGATQRGYISLGRIYEVLDAQDDRAAPSVDLPPAGSGGYAIEVTDLTFRHPQAEHPALRGVSFTVPAGQTLGIFGLTGAGKSTLLDLLARVYDPPRGTVRLAGVDVLDVPVRDFRRAVAYVGQEPFLFSRSIRENVAVATEPGDIDQRRLEDAVEDAALPADVSTFPDGLDTTVGERGVTLSGGQRQRTALARAFYRDFELLLLDDVMSAVDHATERKLIDAVYRHARGRSTIVVSHRISALKDADRVLVLDDGRVVAEGRHAELVEREGPYAKAWQLQRAAEQIEADG